MSAYFWWRLGEVYAWDVLIKKRFHLLHYHATLCLAGFVLFCHFVFVFLFFFGSLLNSRLQLFSFMAITPAVLLVKRPFLIYTAIWKYVQSFIYSGTSICKIILPCTQK